MKKVIKWIVLVWSVFSIPYTFQVVDTFEFFFGLLYSGLIIGLIISDLMEEEKKNEHPKS